MAKINKINSRTRILVSGIANSNDYVDIDMIFDDKSSFYASSVGRALTLCGEACAQTLYAKGINFDYEICNGRLLNEWEETEGRKLDPRTFSDLSFTILNELMRLTATDTKRAKEAA